MLPNGILVKIFDHHRFAFLDDRLFGTWDWYKLTHVCKRWRTVIFGSAHHLKLRLIYTYKKPLRKTLDCWPDLPLSIWYPRLYPYTPLSQDDEENVIAALKYPGRICEINLTLTRPLLRKMIPLMQDPFPVLEHLQLGSRDLNGSFVLPSTFLGRPTPRLRRVDLNLKDTPFPTLPLFIATAPDLVSLRLSEISYTGYFSPEALVNSLDSTPKLKSLGIYWTPPTSHPDQQSPPGSPCPQTRVALPALTEFLFRGDSEYLEDFISRIDAPNVEHFNVTLFEQRTFDLPQLFKSIYHTEEHTRPYLMYIWLWEHRFSITHYSKTPTSTRRWTFELGIPLRESTRQVKLLTNLCKQLSPLFSNVEQLDINERTVLLDLKDHNEAALLLELFSQFGGVRILRLTGHLVPSAALALEQSASETNKGRWDVLPSLRYLHLRGIGPSPPPMESFLAARRRSGHAVFMDYEGTENKDHPDIRKKLLK
jgi:hypothetical protein